MYAVGLSLQPLVKKYILFSGGPIITERISLHFNEHKAAHYVMLNLALCYTEQMNWCT